MENGWEYTTLVNELIEGMELTKQLRVQMNSNSSITTRELLLERILSSYDKALLVLNWAGSVGPLQSVSPTTIINAAPDIDGSPRSEEFEKGYKENLDHKEVSKKRKALPTWTEQVRICPEIGLEGPIEDGYSWRKYGQKDILGAKYPRSYYRCTHRNMQSCWATKQVQRSDNDPTIFEITYRGKHTCTLNSSSRAPILTTSPEKQQAKETDDHNLKNQTQPNELLLNFKTNLRVNTEDLDNKEKACPFTFPSTSFGFVKNEYESFPISAIVSNDPLGSYCQSFISPASSESNYFSMTPCLKSNIGGVHNLQQSEYEFADIISAHTSATNSPILDLDFSTEPIILDSNSPFDIRGFFNQSA